MDTNYSEQNNTEFLSREEIAQFCRRFSGKNEAGENKAVVSYQFFDFDEPENSVNKQSIYSMSRPSLELSFDIKNPRFYTLDIIFQSYTDPELKMFWGRLQRFKRSIVTQGEKTWIFYINVLERDSISLQSENQDTLLIANILNPTIFTLTREIPEYMSTDNIDIDNQLTGGNIVRMLIPIEYVTFEITDKVDTSLIKGEVLREQEEARFINNVSENNFTEW